MKALVGLAHEFVPGLVVLVAGGLFVVLDHATNKSPKKGWTIWPRIYVSRAKELWTDRKYNGNDMIVGTTGPVFFWLGVLGVVVGGVALLLVLILHGHL